MLKVAEAQTGLDNELLGLLTPEERARLAGSTRQVTVDFGQVLYEPGVRITHVYFPSTAVVSCLYTMHDGPTAEMAIIGRDGLVGIGTLLGSDASSHRAMVQMGGTALKLPARALQLEFARGGQFQRVVLRYAQALIGQISQTAVCNCLHSMEQRLCRWLLLCHDRVAGPELLMTQEYIASVLGGRRESVTVAAGRLQDAGLIQYSRGHIRLVDRAGLEAAVCECYRVVRDESERLLGSFPRSSCVEQEVIPKQRIQNVAERHQLGD